MAGNPNPVVVPQDEMTGNPDAAVLIPLVVMVMVMVLVTVDDQDGAGLRGGGGQGAEAEQAAEQNCKRMFHMGFFGVGVPFGRKDR